MYQVGRKFQFRATIRQATWMPRIHAEKDSVLHDLRTKWSTRQAPRAKCVTQMGQLPDTIDRWKLRRTPCILHSIDFKISHQHPFDQPTSSGDKHTVKRRSWMPLFVMFLLTVITDMVVGQNWTQFRGGNGGHAEGAKFPTLWGDETNIHWKAKLPGRGSSSPVVWNDRVYATSFEGFETVDNALGTPVSLKRCLSCIDSKSGKEKWTTRIEPSQAPESYQGFMLKHGYASSTPAVDETGVYLFLGNSGAAKYSHDGQELWSVNCGTGTHVFGSSNSPLLVNDLVVINASIESRTVLAIDKESGEKVWEYSSQDGTDAAHPGVSESWNTPVLVTVDEKRQEIVLSVRGWILALDPDDGTLNWYCRGIDDYVCPSIIAGEGVVYAMGSRRNQCLAIRTGGTGDVSKSHLIWTLDKGSDVSSPLLFEGHLYWANEKSGIVYCVDAESGKIEYEERLIPGPGKIFASPTVADRKIFYVSQSMGTYVIDAKKTFLQLAHNPIRNDTSIFNASPTPVGDRLLLRSDQYLYCIGNMGESSAE